LFSVFRIEDVIQENASTRTILFESGLPGACAGQFVMAWLPGIGEKPFSFSEASPLALTIADVGPVSHAFHQLSVGDRVWIRGPLGRGFDLLSQKPLLVGGGYGAAPLRLLAKTARAHGCEVTVVLGARTMGDLMMVDDFEALSCRVLLATEDGSSGIQGLVTDALEQACSSWVCDGLYACGPTGMLMALGAFALERNLPAQLSFEALIRCGVGLCGSCELPEAACTDFGLTPGFLVCQDGPVARMGF
jgi:dihydroorotate dehydrogenase electron transfer subunit